MQQNIFKEIKCYLKPQQVAEYYIKAKGKRSGNNMFYKSPFRTEKTASFCVNNEKGFHDYGTGWHGDIISFVSELYNCSPLDAAKMLINDFGLPINLNKRMDTKELKEHRKKINLNNKLVKSLDKWFTSTFIKLCDENFTNEKIIKIVSKNFKKVDDESTWEALKYLYDKRLDLQMWLDYFIDANNDIDRLELFRCRKEIEKIWIC